MKSDNPYKNVKLSDKEKLTEFLAVAIAAAMMIFFFVKILFL